MNRQEDVTNKSKLPTPSSQINQEPSTQTAITLKENTISHKDNNLENNNTTSTSSNIVNYEQTSRFSTLLFWNQQKITVREQAILDEQEVNVIEEPETEPETEPEVAPEVEPEAQPEAIPTNGTLEQHNGIVEQPNDTKKEEVVQWWTVPINNFVSYVSTIRSTPNEQTSLIQANSTEQSSFWWNWTWNKPNINEDEYDRAHTSNLELYKSAKTAIESSKEVCHYAFKSSFTDHINTHSKEVELSVFGTLTEHQPVQYHSRKQPLFPNEIQEKSLRTRPGSSSASSMIEGMSNTTTTIKIAPNFQYNYRTVTRKTKLRIISQNLLCGIPPELHLYKRKPTDIITQKRQNLHKIVIIGVHSFLPTKMVRALIGQNTGNSMRFVNLASTAMLKWLSEDRGASFNLDNYDIETIALEGAGKVNERVTILNKLLENWLDMLEQADIIFMVCHGCSSMIGINLFARLLKDHSHWHRKKLGLLTMSGINLGPFIGLDSKLVIRAFTSVENEIIKELFEYQKQNSSLSLQLNESFKVLMQNNVKVTLTGVPTDQFVPLSSSLAVHYQHPNIHRNIYQPQETETHSSDLSTTPFITYLLIVICTMKNLGHDADYNLIRELSDRMINDTNKGHCKVFNEEQVYFEAIRHTLETTNLIHSHDLRIEILKPLDSSSSFYNLLPWNIRSLFQDLININHIKSAELIRELLTRFQDWQPNSKQWKEFKYCLDVLNEFEIEDLFL